MKYQPLNEPSLKWEVAFSKYSFLIETHIARTAAAFDYLLKQNFIESKLREFWSTQTSIHVQVALLVDPNAAEIIFAARENIKVAIAGSLNHQLEDLMAATLKNANISFEHSRPLPWLDQPSVFTKNGIRVDAKGPLHQLNKETIQSPTVSQLSFYVAQIDRALEAIGEISPQALSLIEMFTNTIHLRENPKHPGFSSWSTHIAPGKINGSNFSYVASDLAEVMDFLIHESIHSFLHLIEENYGQFLEPEAYATPWIKEKVVPSPWSGKKIDLGSFTHAIGVWYGLAQFWTKAQGYCGTHAHEITGARVEAMITQASSGFLKQGSVLLATEERFRFLKKDYLSFSLNFQSEIAQLRRTAASA